MNRYLIILLLALQACATPERTVVLVSAIPYTVQPRASMEVYITHLTEFPGDSLLFCEGIVRDSTTNENLIGVNLVYSRTRGTVTDKEGRFRIDSISAHGSLRVSYVGYRLKNIAIRDLPALAMRTPPSGVRHEMSHWDSTELAWSQRINKARLDTAATEIPVTVYVNSENGTYVNPVHMTLSIDHEAKIIEGDFPATGSAISQYNLLLSKGVHQFVAESSNGNAATDLAVAIEKPTWIVITYWGRNHIRIQVSSQPLIFL